MDVTEWKYAEIAGMPPDGEPGYFIGYDADLQPFILKWRSKGERFDAMWLAVTLDDEAHVGGAGPLVLALIGENAKRIVRYAPLPLRWSVLTERVDEALSSVVNKEG